MGNWFYWGMAEWPGRAYHGGICTTNNIVWIFGGLGGSIGFSNDYCMFPFVLAFEGLLAVSFSSRLF
jgi:hypothetical protein